jgi:hypothetical protein
VCCASAGADRPNCGVCAGPAYVVTPPGGGGLAGLLEKFTIKKKTFLFAFLSCACTVSLPRMSIYSLTELTSLSGSSVDLSTLAGKPILVVNVASC